MEEVTRDLLSVINEIDAQSIAKGTPKAGELWIIEKRGMWQKGKAVLEFYPDLEEQIRWPKVGRPKKGQDRATTFRSVADEIGRSATSVKKWTDMFLAVGPTQKHFTAWAQEARLAQEEQWQRKLISKDNTRKEPEPDRKKRVENATFDAVRQRMIRGEWEDGDAQYLFDEVLKLRSGLSGVLGAILDEDYPAAQRRCEQLLSDHGISEGESVA